jgi:hypothetical protein
VGQGFFSLPRWLIVLVCILAVMLAPPISGCYIWGTDSGQCVSDSVGKSGLLWRQSRLPFCSAAAAYPMCIPPSKVRLSEFS